jgi:hypothetical protein
VGFHLIDSAGTVRELAQPEAGRTDVRMNDGACDPQGRFWAGTMAYDESPGAGVLYRRELDGTCTTVLNGLTISNGIGWSPDGLTMYLADSGTRRIDAFDFDPISGDLDRRRPIVRIDAPGVAPDGLTADSERRHLGRALGRRRRVPLRVRRTAAGEDAAPRHAADILRVRRPGPRDAIRDDSQARPGRHGPRSAASCRPPLSDRRPRRAWPAVHDLSRRAVA